MLIQKWEQLPETFQTEAVRRYYDSLCKKKFSLFLKRAFDIVVSFLMLLVLSPILLILSLAIVLDTRGGVFFRQTRVTRYGKTFSIIKFRTMVANAESLGAQVTTQGDMRITRVGRLLRGCRLDELPQLFNILSGSMSFIGTRPEVPKYVAAYTDEMLATLLMPAGVSNVTCILFKDEAKLLAGAEDIDAAYAEKVLPEKMKYNLSAISDFSAWEDILTMWRTVMAVCGKDYSKVLITPAVPVQPIEIPLSQDEERVKA